MSDKDNKIIRLVAYIRIPNSNKSSQVLQEEKTYFSDLVAKRNDCKLVDIYADIGASGMDNTCPEYRRMLADARAGKFDYIVVKETTKLSRDINEFLKIVKELKERNIGIYSIANKTNTLNDANIELLLSISEKINNK